MDILLFVLLCLVVIGILSIVIVYKFDRKSSSKEFISQEYDSKLKGK